MDNVKTNKLTALISKLTIAANKSVKKPVQELEPQARFSITGLNSNVSNYGRSNSMRNLNLLRS